MTHARHVTVLSRSLVVSSPALLPSLSCDIFHYVISECGDSVSASRRYFSDKQRERETTTFPLSHLYYVLFYSPLITSETQFKVEFTVSTRANGSEVSALKNLFVNVVL